MRVPMLSVGRSIVRKSAVQLGFATAPTCRRDPAPNKWLRGDGRYEPQAEVRGQSAKDRQSREATADAAFCRHGPLVSRTMCS